MKFHDSDNALSNEEDWWILLSNEGKIYDEEEGESNKSLSCYESDVKRSKKKFSQRDSRSCIKS